jgi:2-oxoglutarate decarboxylase
MGWFDRPELGANVGLIDEIYRQYLDNPESVSPAWRDFFAENEPEEDGGPEASQETAEGRVETEGGQAPEGAAPANLQEPAPAVDNRERAPSGSATLPHRGPEPGGGPTQAAPPPKAPATAEDKPKPKPAPEGDGKAEVEVVPLRGAAARIVEAMEASREVPTATSVRTVPARLLEVNRSVLNGHLRRRQGGKVSFTHLIAYAVVKALEAVPVMATMYREV